MKQCLITNEVCKTKKCKVCTFDSCKEVIKMLDIQDKYIRKERLAWLKKELPKECKNCSHLEIIDLKNMKVRCFYRIKDCILKEK